jgi:hypothetical protein
MKMNDYLSLNPQTLGVSPEGIVIFDAMPVTKRGARSLREVMAEINSLNGVASFIWEVTPEDAQWLLETQHPNRSLSTRIKGRIVDDLDNGWFMYNGKPILVCQEDGREFDGQHRCSACVQSGQTFYARIEVLPFAVHKVVDINDMPRSFADILKISGVKDPKTIQAICNWIYRSHHPDMLNGRHTPSPRALELEVFKTFGGEVKAALKIFNSKSAKRLKFPSWFASCYILAARFDAKLAEEFFVNQLVYGCNLTRTSPAWHLRERAYKVKTAKGSEITKAQATTEYLLQITFKMWNAFLEDRVVKNLSLTATEKYLPVGWFPESAEEVQAPN